ncbi:DNA glycosylase/AP lyase ROS1-like [Rhododendron vialii]|uniref:DNA glycosylase/AP lyase ROS1-like n=1 Tax=Rhododendron vialii TaxID=182163 RepID=UPI0026601ADA|nr:DNA glycosylase/AP lyase ROS1-like [Rhododendron vialii]XP_058204081.1 DNA glycosylase/AP lyase ROS1-like [Rhododendron vialii]
MPRRVDKAGKIGRLPVSRDAEMDVGRESSIPKLKEFQVQSSCVPMTPMQPIVQRPQPTGTERREDQLGQENKLPQETQAHRVAAYCESLKSIDVDQGFANWEVNLSQISSNVRYSSQFFMEANKLESGPFTNLRTLEHLEKNSACATQKGTVNAASSSVIPVSDSTCDDNQLEATSTTSLVANEDENSAPAGPAYDLNSPPRITCSSWNSPSQFSPITPDQSNKSENKEAHVIAILNIDERANQEREKRGDNIDTSEFEVEELPKDLACAVVSTQLHENHDPDKASNLAIDLNTTPQQKERRRKHRPKVVIEGQAKRTRKPACPADTPTGKRKYVRKNKLDKTPSTPTAEATSRTTDMEPAPPAAKLCKRKLNFDSDSQVTEEECSLSRLQSKTNAESESHAQNFYTRVESNTNAYTRVGIAYEPTYPMTKVVEDCISNQERRAPNPQTTNRTDPLHEHSKGRDQDAPIEGKCQIVFSDETHVERESIIQGISYGGEPEKELERGNPRMSYEVEHSRTNVIGCRYNALHGYWAMIPADMYNNTGIPGMYFDANYKKKRIEKGHSSTTSSTLSNVTVAEGIPQSMTNACPACLENAQFISSSISTKTASVIGAQGKEQTFECRLALNQKGRISKKRAKNHNPTGMFGSLIEFVECRPKPTLPAEGVPKMGVMQGYEVFNHPPTCMDAPMKMKKETKRKAGSEAIKRKIPSPDELTEQLKRLDISNQEQRSLAPCYFRYEDLNALVIYQGHGSVVPFEGSFNPVRKRKPRPKVDVDEETNRVWKLLLENINSEGINGTDEEKAKWWEEERRVFRGRADSFIARMHLIQGDRRFSPWKGSVLDSVIGVFLTQNVSDHLSSSAFMSLAAHFPLKSKSNERPCSVETCVLDKDKEVCRMDPEDTMKWQWREEKSNQPASNRSSVTSHETDYFPEKVVANSNESLGSSMDGEKSVDNLECKTSDISRDGLQIYDESTTDRKVIQLIQDVASSTGDNREVDDVLSSQYSSSSSPNSVNSSMAQTAERIGSFFHDNSEAADRTLRQNPEIVAGSSFMELLRRQEEGIHNHKTGNVSPCEANGYSCTENYKRNQIVQQVQELPNLSRETLDATESTSITSKPKNTEHKEVDPCAVDRGYVPDIAISGKSSDSSSVKGVRIGEQKQNTEDWDSLRLQAQAEGKRRERTTNTMDSLDWEAVRCADVSEIAYTIRERGMNNRLAERIKDFLNRLVQDHGSIDLEWLRDVPPDKAKEYLLSVRGLGLKSVECVRLLTLHHLAFPVDTNVGRIAVRLGWVPLQPLPESLQLHLLELYPVLESIQRYLWPRLCKLNQRTLYELHYQMITFGKVFCTKSKPNCNACPLRGECRHFASAFASARLALPGLEEKSIVSATESKAASQIPVEVTKPLQLPLPQANRQLQVHSQINNCEPIVEMPASPEPTIEVPATPETEVLERDIEDAFYEDPEEIPMIKLNIEEFTQNLQHYMQQNLELCEGDISKALVALTPEAASIPVPKLKYINRLRTEHQVYELPDSHPLLEGLDNREPDDPCSYLLAIWTPGETANSIEPPEKSCGSQEFGKLCDENTCFSCNSTREANSQIVRGTILIPCRTAMRGSFPLNGTYFQVNEVFADHESSINPIDVPRAWIWNLPRRTVFFGTSIPTIFRGLSTESIQYCFWRGFVCVRGFERKTRAPRPLLARLHFPASKLKGTKGDTNVKQG